MTEYISKSALLAEIERLFEKAGNSLGEYRNGAEHTLISINDFLDTLEVKEVDLEKKYKDFIKSDNGRSMFETAKHFFELGMQVSNKAQKGE